LADGFSVTLLESSDQLGGLGTFFRYGEQWLDRFYHCIMPSDAHLLGLIDEAGLSSALYWRPTTMGFAHGGKHYDFNTPLDLLRFAPLAFHERLRLGATGAVLRHLGDPAKLDDMTTEQWMSGLFGRSLWEKFWRPLFFAKFGERAAQLPALYIWQRLGRESNAADRGYLRCGLHGLIGALAKLIRSRGGEIHTDAPVLRIDPVAGVDGPLRVQTARGTFLADWVVCTTPIPLLAKMVEGNPLHRLIADPELPYQGVVNTLFFLERPLANHYWSPVVSCGTEFDGVVEMTTLVETSRVGGLHLAYAMKYTPRDSALFAEPDASIAARWSEQLAALYRPLGLRREDIVDTRVFRTPFVEPSYPLGYSRTKPDFSLGDSRILLASTAQVYPHITSWNSAVRLCEETLQHLYRRAGQRAPRTFARKLAA
jgi:protoporphyrinogen oxidase